MGKGDIKSKRGKIARGTHGARRKRKSSTFVSVAPSKPKKSVKAVKESTATETPKKTTAKRATSKKSADKGAES